MFGFSFFDAPRIDSDDLRKIRQSMVDGRVYPAWEQDDYFPCETDEPFCIAVCSERGITAQAMYTSYIVDADCAVPCVEIWVTDEDYGYTDKTQEVGKGQVRWADDGNWFEDLCKLLEKAVKEY